MPYQERFSVSETNGGGSHCLIPDAACPGKQKGKVTCGGERRCAKAHLRQGEGWVSSIAYHCCFVLAMKPKVPETVLAEEMFHSCEFLVLDKYMVKTLSTPLHCERLYLGQSIVHI